MFKHKNPNYPYGEAPDIRTLDELRREVAILTLENAQQKEQLRRLEVIANARGRLVEDLRTKIFALKEVIRLLKLMGKGLIQGIETKEAESSTDPLTGLLNKRGFELAVGQTKKIARRTEHKEGSVTKGDVLLFIDIDNFKKINDGHGHHVGDDALKALAIKLREFVREADIVGRIGGDEFVVFFPEATISEILEKFKTEDVEKASLRVSFKNSKQEDISFTTSGGLVSVNASESLDHAKKRADAFLYKAKLSGKDKIQIAEDMKNK